MEKILIVDDDASTLQHIKALLTSFGYASASLPQPKFLLKRLAAEPFDLILLDLNMPEVSGIEILSQLKAHSDYKKIPVIMLTGEKDKRSMTDCFEHGAIDFIHKPINDIEMKARVKTALATRATTEQLESLVLQRTAELERSYTELEQINQTFQLFVPQQFLQRILTRKFTKSNHMEEEHLTILFGDIRSYTSHVETMSSQENLQFLNEFFGLIEPCIAKHHGFIDKYMGDGIMALFDQEQSADHAIQAAIEMQEVVARHNQKREQKGLPAIYFGIGINTGKATIGTLGSTTRLDSTVIGDHVNLASRLETLTKKFNSRILISHHTYGYIDEDTYQVREIDTVRVKGRTRPVSVYEIFDCDPLPLREKKEKTKDLLFKGISLYKALMFDLALEAFQEMLDTFPQDVIALDYVKRTRYFQKYPPNVNSDEMWLGIVRDTDQLIDRLIRRRAERYAVSANVKIWPYGIEKAYTGIIRDISIIGLQIEMELPVHQGDILYVEISFEQEPRIGFPEQNAHRVLGRVMWSKLNLSKEGNSVCYAGLEIIVMTQQQEEFLEYSLRQFKKKAFFTEGTYRIENGICLCLFGYPAPPKIYGTFKKELDALLQSSDITTVLFNFSYITQVDSTLVGIIVSIFKTLQSYNISMALCEVEELCCRALSVVQLDKLIDLYKTEEEALTHLI